MKKLKIFYLLVLGLLLAGCTDANKIEIFRFVNHENEIYVDDTIKLDLIYGEYSTDSKVTYTLSEEGIIELVGNEAKGLVAGEVQVTATIDNVKFARTTIIVRNRPLDGMQITSSKTTNIVYIGETVQFNIIVFPKEFLTTVTWSLEGKKDAATIDQNGLFTPKIGEQTTAELNAGGVKITVVAKSKTDPNMIAKREVFIRYRPTQSITLSTKDNINEIYYGESLELNPNITPENANKLVTYTSSDVKVAVVNEYGIVTTPEEPIEGEVTITAKTLDGKTATITIVVLNPNPETNQPEE